jgi:hypothetical protein
LLKPQVFLWAFHASGPFPNNSASLSPFGCRPSRIASTMSGARQVTIEHAEAVAAAFRAAGIAEWRELRDVGEEVVNQAIQAALDENRAPTPGDYFEIIVRQTSRSTRNVAADELTWFAVEPTSTE